jgi:cytochrome o ubiquinol oxidase subunit 2
MVVPVVQFERAHRPGFIYSGQIELVTWSIPLLTIMLLGGVAWRGSHDLDPARPLPSDEAPLKVQAVSLDWKWLFIYPRSQHRNRDRLVIPVGAPVHFTLTSACNCASGIPRLPINRCWP